MKVISETIDGENYLEIIFTEKECRALNSYTFLTKVIKILGKPVNLGMYRTFDEELEEKD